MYSIEEFDSEKTKVLRYILFKKRTEYEVRTKFNKIIEEELLEDIIEYLKEARYIDDKEYLDRAINNFMALKNLSVRELKYKIISKGIKKDLIDDYFYDNKEELEEYEIKSARNIYYKKEKNTDIEEIKNYLLKKGYKLENINIALES